MFWISVAMLVVVVVAALVVTYVAFPHRGEEVPGAAWLGDAMTKGVEAMPNLTEDEHQHPAPSREQDAGTAPGSADGSARLLGEGPRRTA